MLKKLLCQHGDMVTYLLNTIKLPQYNIINMETTKHVDADKSTTQVFEMILNILGPKGKLKLTTLHST